MGHAALASPASAQRLWGALHPVPGVCKADGLWLGTTWAMQRQETSELNLHHQFKAVTS